ncbi:MAG: carbon-nitrogen hydrolase family protein [Campylobacterota bacterium]|nr:carbon-nitrogen hydrolase family protein [Campylobacterota bacterium]
MTSKINLVALQLKTSSNFKKNFKKLEKKILQSPNNSFILAPELYISAYAYDRLNEAVEMTNKVIPRLLKLSTNKTISLTMITKKDKHYYNTLFIFHKNKLIHTQSKNKLFVMNDERKYFTKGDEKDIKIIDIDGLKVAALICFELRYINLWQKIQGADLILIPAMWGKLRKSNFETLTSALAVANQCFVLASDSSNKNMAKSSAIISPFGDIYLDNNKKIISKEVDLKEIKKMRRYLNIGLITSYTSKI